MIRVIKVSINTKVRLYEVTSQLDVPTSLTSVPSHLLCFHFVCCAKEVSDLVNCPVLSLQDLVGEEVKGVGVMKDEDLKIEEIEVSHTLGGCRRCRCYSTVRYTKDNLVVMSDVRPSGGVGMTSDA